MAATLTFAGRTLAGTPEQPKWTAPQAHVRTIKLWGLIGEGELNGFRGGRDIFVPCVIHKNLTSYAALDALLKQADAMVGTVGALLITNTDVGFSFSRPNCSFRGFTPDQSAEAGPVYSPTGPITGWWVRGVLQFRQLRDT